MAATEWQRILFGLGLGLRLFDLVCSLELGFVALRISIISPVTLQMIQRRAGGTPSAVLLCGARGVCQLISACPGTIVLRGVSCLRVSWPRSACGQQYHTATGALCAGMRATFAQFLAMSASWLQSVAAADVMHRRSMTWSSCHGNRQGGHVRVPFLG
jgi:hypothetical protein